MKEGTGIFNLAKLNFQEIVTNAYVTWQVRITQSLQFQY